MQLTPDPLSKSKDQTNTEGGKPKFTDPIYQGRFDHVRRPIRGTQFKGESFATLEIKTKDGKNLLMYDSGGLIEDSGIAYSPRNSNFLLTSVQESRMERSQIMETFGPSYIFFFGERPTALTFSGVLLNSADFNWKNEFWSNYDKYLRGTQCVTYATQAYISYDDVIKKGYILSASSTQSADPDQLVDFNFQLIVSQHVDLSIVGSPEFPTNQLFATQVDMIVDDSATEQSLIDQLGGSTTFGKISDNEDEYVAKVGSKNQQIVDSDDKRFQRQKSLEDLVRAWFSDHGMVIPGQNPVPNLENIGGSGVSIHQIMGWAGGATFTSINLAREAKNGLDSKDKNAEESLDKAKVGGVAARIGRLV